MSISAKIQKDRLDDFLKAKGAKELKKSFIEGKTSISQLPKVPLFLPEASQRGLERQREKVIDDLIVARENFKKRKSIKEAPSEISREVLASQGKFRNLTREVVTIRLDDVGVDFLKTILARIRAELSKKKTARFLNVVGDIEDPSTNLVKTVSTGFIDLVSKRARAMKDIEDFLINILSEYEDFTVLKRLELVFVSPIKGKKFTVVGHQKMGGLLTPIGDGFYWYSPKTFRHCFYHCLAIGLDPQYLLDKLSKDPKRKKRLDNRIMYLFKTVGSKKHYSDLADMEKAAKQFGCTLVIETIDGVEILGSGEKIINMMTMGTHNHIQVKVSLGEEEVERHRKEQMFLQPCCHEKEFDINYVCADLETFTDQRGVSVPYMAGYGYYLRNTEKKTIHQLEPVYRSWKRLDCLQQFFDSLENEFYETNITVLFHNGGKFDVDVIFSNFIQNSHEWQMDKMLDNGGRYLVFQVSKGRTRVTFKDSCAFFNSSLAAITDPVKGFQVIHSKLEINHELITEKTWDSTETDTYFQNDILGLLEAWDILSKTIYASFKINPVHYVSAANVDMKIFRSKFLKRDMWYLPTHEEDTFIRESYHGGRNEAFYIGEVSEELKYYDFTSLYPAMACKPLPHGALFIDKKSYDWGKPMDRKIMIAKCRRKGTFIRCLLKTRRFDRKPLIATKNQDGRLLFQHLGDWTEVTITGPELLLIAEHNLYDVKVLEVRYQAGVMKPYFAEFHKTLFEWKNKAKIEGRLGESESFKVALNSLYGVTGMNLYGKSSSKIMAINDYTEAYMYSRLVDGSLKSFKECGDYVLMNVQEDNKSKASVGVASYITAYARCELWSLMTDIEATGGKIYYCDTDSIFTDIDLSNKPKLMRQYGTGTTIGSLKDELAGGRASKMVITGCKAYCFKHGEKFKAAMKGVKTPLTRDDYVGILTHPKDVEKLVFKKERVSSKDNGIYIQKIPHRIQCNYVKGQVQPTGWVTPFVYAGKACKVG